MSWYLKLVGTASAVKAQLANETTVSQKIRDAIAEIADEPGYGGQQTAILVEGSGHSGGAGSSIINLKVERVLLCAEPAETPASVGAVTTAETAKPIAPEAAEPAAPAK